MYTFLTANFKPTKNVQNCEYYINVFLTKHELRWVKKYNINIELLLYVNIDMIF
jgi:hypothetical protein